ncbi:hypothetical protein FACS1894199_02780 [Bacteroidia bacterium]|nr:hypothetical protein FACS1894199_02780 [Bacteroidia bacterium]
MRDLNLTPNIDGHTLHYDGQSDSYFFSKIYLYDDVVNISDNTIDFSADISKYEDEGFSLYSIDPTTNDTLIVTYRTEEKQAMVNGIKSNVKEELPKGKENIEQAQQPPIKAEDVKQWTPKLALEAVKQEGTNLKFVPDKLKTKTICTLAQEHSTQDLKEYFPKNGFAPEKCVRSATLQKVEKMTNVPKREEIQKPKNSLKL